MRVLTKTDLLEKIKRISSVKGSCRLDQDLGLKVDHMYFGKVVGGVDAEEYHRLMKIGDIYCPRPGYVKPSG